MEKICIYMCALIWSPPETASGFCVLYPWFPQFFLVIPPNHESHLVKNNVFNQYGPKISRLGWSILAEYLLAISLWAEIAILRELPFFFNTLEPLWNSEPTNKQYQRLRIMTRLISKYSTVVTWKWSPRIKTLQELRMLFRLLSECQSLTLNVMMRVSQFVRNAVSLSR